MKIFKFLQTPFPRPKNTRKNILWLLFIGIGASIFILVFKPFDIENQTGELYVDLIIFSLGIVFFISVYLMEFLLPRLLPNMIKKWTLGKAILWYAWVILFVSAVMFIYKSYLDGFRDFTWTEYVFILGRILGIGITVSFFVLGIFNYFNRKDFSLLSSKEDFLVTSPSAKSIRINLNEVMYIVSDDNYVDIHIEKKGKRSKLVFRSSLKNLEEQIVNPLTPIYRCHRRHLINIEYFKIKSDLSRNTSVQLKNYDDVIPVSKQYAERIINLLQVRPKN